MGQPFEFRLIFVAISVPPLYFEKKTFPAEFASLKEIGEFVRLATLAAGCNPSTSYAIQLAVDEACSNIIEHAYHSVGVGEIECTCSVTKKSLEILLHDHGEPFNPSGVSQPDITTELENRTRGGLGLYFIRQLMDEVSFRFESPQAGKPKESTGNFLRMIKYRKDAKR